MEAVQHFSGKDSEQLQLAGRSVREKPKMPARDWFAGRSTDVFRARRLQPGSSFLPLALARPMHPCRFRISNIEQPLIRGLFVS